ncbi:MAG TPA: hypothetical protein VFI42_15870 [Thermomicrobiaceae bacterium]|nr:hypothetical protein [Thermomicrobiaceae bacterium]HEX5416254.1 hypothetical protein [Chloroflexota bacterium]
MPAIFLLVIVIILAIVGLVRWSTSRKEKSPEIHDHPIDRDSSF